LCRVGGFGKGGGFFSEGGAVAELILLIIFFYLNVSLASPILGYWGETRTYRYPRSLNGGDLGRGEDEMAAFFGCGEAFGDEGGEGF